MDHTFISQESFTIVGYTFRIDPKQPQQIDAAWAKFQQADPKERIGNRVNDDIWSVYYAYEGDQNQPYSMLIGYRVSFAGTPDPDLAVYSVPANYYAMFFAQGELPLAVQEAWINIYAAGLKRTFQADFEVYGRFAQDPSDAEVPIYVSVEE